MSVCLVCVCVYMHVYECEHATLQNEEYQIVLLLLFFLSFTLYIVKNLRITKSLTNIRKHKDIFSYKYLKIALINYMRTYIPSPQKEIKKFMSWKYWHVKKRMWNVQTITCKYSDKRVQRVEKFFTDSMPILGVQLFPPFL